MSLEQANINSSIIYNCLTKVGTGNVSVAAAFVHARKSVAIFVVLAEISRGITPVLAANLLFPEIPTWELIGLIFLVAGRYFIAQGGGVTNVSWGVLVYSAVVALASGITGFLILVIGPNGRLVWDFSQKDRYILICIQNISVKICMADRKLFGLVT